MVERLVANEKVEGSSPFARSRNLKYLWKIYLKKCIPCEGGIPAFDQEEIQNLKKRLLNVLKDKENNFYRKFKFKDYIARKIYNKRW